MKEQLLTWGQSRRFKDKFLGLSGRLGFNVVKNTEEILLDIRSSGLAHNNQEAVVILEQLVNKRIQHETHEYFVLYELSPNIPQLDGSIPAEYILRSYHL